MKSKKRATVALSGYSTEKIISLYPSSDAQYVITILSKLIDRLLIELYHTGYRRFLCGMHEGFEQLAAKRIIKMRKKNGYDDIELIAVLTSPHKIVVSSIITESFYPNILHQVDTIVYLNIQQKETLNDYLFDHADMLCCFQADTIFKGEAGETRTLSKRFRNAGRCVNDIVPM